jgi:hypothetical protein
MGDPSQEYAINAADFRQGIEWWLDPVIDRLGEIDDSFRTAGEKAQAGLSNAPGWVGGEGHGEVRSACQSFFDQVTASIQFLRIDQGQVVDSMAAYKDMALKHIAWAERIDADHAQHFNSIADTMGGGY